MDQVPPSSQLDALLARQLDSAHRGQQIPVEELLQEQPQLREDREAILDLIYQEILIRETAGETPTLNDYVARFPELEQELELQFQIEQLISNDVVFATKGASPTPEDSAPAAYEILEVVGQGGMGVVYKAIHQPLLRIVALKMIQVSGLIQQEKLIRFRTEAETIASLQHPNIVQIFELGEFKGQPFLALEFMEGGDLASQLKGDPLPARTAAVFAATLSRTMDYAHHRGVVHRDLKPGNILLGANSTEEQLDLFSSFKVTDFGLAKQLNEGHAVTEEGNLLGTPSYMSPEQAAGKNESLTTAVDTYAIGAILYELLTGRPPFKAENPIATLSQVLSMEPVAPTLLNPNCPADLETICLKCLEKDPARRYESCLALAEDLDRWLVGKPIFARPVSPVERGLKWVRRHPAESALVSTGLVTLCVVVALLVGALFYQQLSIQRDQKEMARAELELKNRDILAKNQTISSQNKIIQRLLYNTDMQAAGIAWMEGRIATMRTHLDRYKFPVGDEQDIRGFEWHYLQRLSDTSLKRWSLALPPEQLAFDSEGERLAVSDSGGHVEVWQVWNGKQILKWSLRSNPREACQVHSLAFSPKHNRLGIALDNRVAVYDLSTGKQTHTLTPSKGRATNSIAFSTDGNLLIGTNRFEIKPGQTTTHVWDLRTSQVVAELQQRPSPESFKPLVGSDNSCAGIVISPAGTSCAVIKSKKLLSVWDYEQRKPLHAELADGRRDIKALAYSRDGAMIAAASVDGTVKFWSVAEGKLHQTLRHSIPVVDLAFHPDGSRLLTVGEDRGIHIWDVASGQELYQLRGHLQSVRMARYTDSGRAIVSIDESGELRIWEARHPQEWYTGLPGIPPLSGPFRQKQPAIWTKNGREFSYGYFNESILSRTAETATLVRNLQVTPVSSLGVATLELASDESILGYALAGLGEIRFLDFQTGKVLGRKQMVPFPSVLQIALLPNRQYAAFARGGPVVLMTVPDCHAVLDWPAHETPNNTTTVAASPDGKLLVFGDKDGQLHWIRLPDELANLPRYTKDFYDARGQIQVDVTDATVHRRVQAHTGLISNLTFSSDGQWMASAGVDAKVHIWDVSSGGLFRTLEHSAGVFGLSFHPDGSRLATTGADQTARLWDTITWQQTLVIRSHGDEVMTADFSPDGDRLMTTCRDGWIRLFDGRPIRD